MSARALTDSLMRLLAIAAIAIGAALFLVGPSAAASWVASVVKGLTGWCVYSGGLEHPNTDSEMRFFAVYWLGFGLWIWTKLRGADRDWIPIALMLFWLGGVGRLLSLWQTGQWPDPLFQVLGAIELIAPAVVFALHRMHGPSTSGIRS